MDTEEQKETLERIIKQFDQAMLITKHDGDSGLNARPMSLLEVDDDGALTFMTDLGSNKVDEILTYPEVCVTMQDGARSVSLGGTATISQDRERIRELWKPQFERWLEGPDAPTTALIEVRPRMGEFWDSTPGTFFKLVVKEAKNLFGQRDKDVDWEDRIHGRVDLKAAS